MGSLTVSPFPGWLYSLSSDLLRLSQVKLGIFSKKNLQFCIFELDWFLTLLLWNVSSFGSNSQKGHDRYEYYWPVINLTSPIYIVFGLCASENWLFAIYKRKVINLQSTSAITYIRTLSFHWLLADYNGYLLSTDFDTSKFVYSKLLRS